MKIACTEVEIVESRWSVRITVRNEGEVVEELIASADRGLTEGSGIWIGSAEEFEEASSW